MAFPFRGWNEGFTTSAPLVYLALKGQNVLPVSPKLILDVVPVDHVVSGMLMVAAQAIVEQPKLVFQLSSGDLNPLQMDRVVTLTGLYKRQALPRQGDGQQVPQRAGGAHGVPPGHQESYDRYSIPTIQQRRPQGVARRWGASGRAGARGGSRRSSIGSRRGSTRSTASPARRR